MNLIKKDVHCPGCKEYKFSYYRLGKIIKQRLKGYCFKCIVTPGLKKFMNDSYGVSNA